MADDSQGPQPGDLDALLKEAQAGMSGAPANPPAGDPAAAKPAASDNLGLGQAELEAILKSTGAAATPPPRPKADSGVAPGDIDYLLQQAEQALASINSPVSPAGQPPVKPFKFQDFAGAPATTDSATLELLRDVELDVKIELGRSQMYLEDVLKLRKGSVVGLDKLAGDPVDIYVNGRLIARGEVLVLNDNFCVRVAELVAAENAA